MVNQEDNVIWIHSVRWNVPDRRAVLQEGRTSAPLKFRLCLFVYCMLLAFSSYIHLIKYPLYFPTMGARY